MAQFNLETSSIKAALAQKDHFVNEYTAIQNDYNDIVKVLSNNWKGKGAEAFVDDANKVRTNITGIYDILKIMCDTLTDCLAIYEECDKALGEFNRNPSAT